MSDPTYINPKDATQGSEGRIPLGLFPETARLAGALAFKEGQLKYGQYNYRVAPVSAEVYYSALGRHLAAWWDGQDIDQDSGLPHLWKALACIAILIDAKACGTLTDTRPPSAPTAGMLKDLQPVARRLVADLQQRYTPCQYTIADTPQSGGAEDHG